jgi:Flp pilus assembly pilin Flp
MKNWIMNFIADERGAETTEFGVVTTLTAAGSVASLSTVKSKLQGKANDLAGALDSATDN